MDPGRNFGVKVNTAPLINKIKLTMNICQSAPGSGFSISSNIILHNGPLIGTNRNIITIPSRCRFNTRLRQWLSFSINEAFTSYFENRIGQRVVPCGLAARPWCRGSTRGFQPLCPGSNPGGRTNVINSPSIGVSIGTKDSKATPSTER